MQVAPLPPPISFQCTLAPNEGGNVSGLTAWEPLVISLQGKLLEKPHDFSHLHQRTIRITYAYIVNTPGKWSIFYLGASDEETRVLQDKRCETGKVMCGEHL